jgi:cell division protein FtsB
MRVNMCQGAFSSPSVAESTGLTRERARALITENESLKADNAALRANVFRLQDELAQWPPVKAEEDVSQASQYEEVNQLLFAVS